MTYSQEIKTSRMQVIQQKMGDECYLVFGDTIPITSPLCKIKLNSKDSNLVGNTLIVPSFEKEHEIIKKGTSIVAEIQKDDGDVLISNISVGVLDCEINLPTTDFISGMFIKLENVEITHS